MSQPPAAAGYEFDPLWVFTYSSPVNIDEASRNWTDLGEGDPLWVVLTDPDKKGNRWKVDEFFATGRSEIQNLYQRVEAAGLTISPGRGLDFGCGVGRLTQALAERFAAVDGVDISASMIRHAESFQRVPDRVKYHLNVRSDLKAFPSAQYDFICSLIALQHTPPHFQRRYIADFVRLLKPGGCACFQTIHARGWRRWIPDWFADFIRKRRSGGAAFIPLYGLSPDDIRRIVGRSGGRVVMYQSAPYAGWESRYGVDFFVIGKNPT